MIKKYKKFLEEVTIKGNPGIPGEGDSQEGDKDYLNDMERSARNKYNAPEEKNPMETLFKIMNLTKQSSEMIEPHKEELEKLAEDIIRDEFGDILDGVRLDIKFAKDGEEVSNFMKQEKNEEEEAPKMQEITDKSLINKIHKAKLANVLTQGEAKNTKHILNLPESKESIQEIFGNDFDKIMNIWNDITEAAETLDWLIPIERKADMMENAPQGMAGAVKVDWEKKDEETQDEKEQEVDVDKLLSNDEEASEEQETDNEYTPVVKARGIDFPMLLHETVKGILELIAAVYQPDEGATPKEIEDAKTVKYNVSSSMDEAEDFRTGPEIAADLRDFINESPKSDYSNVMRLYVYGKILDPNYMSEEEFLKLFRGMLNETNEARIKIDKIVEEIVEELKSYEMGEVLGHEEDDKEYSGDIDYDSLGIKPSKEDNIDKEDLSELSEKELLALMDDALDSGDAKRMQEIGNVLSKFHNESLTTQIYLRELETIKENQKYRNKK